MTRLQFVPPKPNELLRAKNGLAASVCDTIGKPLTMSSGSSRFVVGAKNWSRIISMQKIASWEPAAPSEWPVIDFVDENLGMPERPKTFTVACSSEMSPTGVEVA